MSDDLAKDQAGMTFRQLLYEVRKDVKEVKTEVDNVQITLAGLDAVYLTKKEYAVWQEIQRTTRRWAITTIISLSVVGLMILGVVLTVSS